MPWSRSRSIGGFLPILLAAGCCAGGDVEPAKLDEVCDFLSVNRDDVLDAQWIDNGPGWLGILLDSAQTVLSIKAPGSHHRRIEVGLVGAYPQGSDIAFELRALFSDHSGNVREDPVTGSLNASVAQWLLGSGQARSPYVAAQGRCVGREGRISVDEDSSGTIWIGGHTSSIVEGFLNA